MKQLAGYKGGLNKMLKFMKSTAEIMAEIIIGIFYVFAMMLGVVVLCGLFFALIQFLIP